MPGCEKCWRDALMLSLSNGKSQSDNYYELIEERYNNCCSAEEQAGYDAKLCPTCLRLTIHQVTKECGLCGHKENGFENNLTNYKITEDVTD